MQHSIVMDIGGTNARIATSDSSGIEDVINYRCDQYPDGPAAVIDAYFTTEGLDKSKFDNAVIAVAGPIDDPAAHICTNGAWTQEPVNFQDIGIPNVKLINDFAAQALATISMEKDKYMQIVGAKSVILPCDLQIPAAHSTAPSDATIIQANAEHRFLVLGPGTGLGVANICFAEGKFIVLDGEGSHATFPSKSPEEAELVEKLRQKFGEVSFETICSGPGLVRTYNALNGQEQDIEPHNVVELSQNGNESARKAVELFTKALGRCASAGTLNIKSQGGVIIAGGLIGKLGDSFDVDIFEKEFRANDLSQSANFMRNTPVHAMTDDQSGLIGAHAFAQFGMK